MTMRRKVSRKRLKTKKANSRKVGKMWLKSRQKTLYLNHKLSTLVATMTLASLERLKLKGL